MPHFNFLDVVNSMANPGWGKDFGSTEEAQRHLLESPEKLTAFALVELLSRLEALGRSTGPPKEDRVAKIDEDTGRFPDVQVGAMLYRFWADEGLDAYVVVRKGPLGECFVVEVTETDLPPTHRVMGWWMSDTGSTTPEEAMRSEFEQELETCSQRVEFFRRALAAISDGDDLTPYLVGCDEWTKNQAENG